MRSCCSKWAKEGGSRQPFHPHPEAEDHYPGISSLLLHQLQGVYAVKVCVMSETNYGAYFGRQSLHISIFIGNTSL
jgi:hypothetical protein